MKLQETMSLSVEQIERVLARVREALALEERPTQTQLDTANITARHWMTRFDTEQAKCEKLEQERDAFARRCIVMARTVPDYKLDSFAILAAVREVMAKGAAHMTELNESERKELEEVLCDAPLSSEGEAAVLIPFINHLLVQREAAAYEAAAQLADEWFRTCRTEPRVKPTAEGIQILAVRIRALTPADAQAALDNLLDERARVEFEGGIRVATEELRGGALRQEHPALVEFRAALQSAVRESAKGLREALSYYAASQSYKHGTLSQPKVIEDSGVIATKALATHAAQFPPAEESNIFNLEYANQKDFYDKHGK